MASERNRWRNCSERGSMESRGKRRRKGSERGSESSGGKRRRNCCASSSSPQGGEVCAIDRISDLPESIISYILSFLPMKSALATSILSKTWKFYWSKVTTFDFDDNDPKSRNMDFVEFVNMVLVKQTYESIQKLRLRLSHLYTPDLMVSDLERWTLTAISRNVRVLDLSIELKIALVVDQFRLPDALYTCRTLEVLKLRGMILVNAADVVVSLPKLHELELIKVSYESNESLPKLIAGCPVLEKLTSWFQDGEYNMTICTISSASLKYLQIYFKETWGVGAMKVEIDAPALEQLYINDRWSRQISIHNRLTQLDKGYLDVPCSTSDVQQVKIAELLQAFPRAKTLRICGDTMTVISNSTNKLSVNFERLTSLYMNIKRHGWKCLVDLLDCCIKLQFMFITCCGESDRIKWMDLVRIPKCLSSSLRFLAIKSFSGSEEEMVLLKFILHHGLVMERVYLWYPSCDLVDAKRRRKILKMVSKLPKASPNCEIVEWNSRMRWTLTE